MNREELEGVIGHEVSHIPQLRYSNLYHSSCLSIGYHHASWDGSVNMMLGEGHRRNDDDRNGSSGLEIILLIISLMGIIPVAPLAATCGSVG